MLDAFCHFVKAVNTMEKVTKVDVQSYVDKVNILEQHCLEEISSKLRNNVKSLEEMRRSIEARCTVDIAAVMKDYERHSHELIDFRGRSELSTMLKAFNGTNENGGGLKEFDKYVTCMAAAGLASIDSQNLEEVRKNLVATRNKGRTLLWSRGACVTLSKRKASEVDGLYRDAKNLKVNIHKSLKTRLDQLASGG